MLYPKRVQYFFAPENKKINVIYCKIVVIYDIIKKNISAKEVSTWKIQYHSDVI